MSRAAATLLLLLTLGASWVAGADDLTAAALRHEGASADPQRTGIWKAAVPPEGSMRGEFDNNDPIGVTAGVRIAADCSINWVDPDDRRLYCFSSATSLVYFLDDPQSFLRRARAQWRVLAPPVS